jgi:hypothetical protein
VPRRTDRWQIGSRKVTLTPTLELFNCKEGRESCKGTCEEKTWSVQFEESQLLEAVTREGLVETAAD